MERITRQAGHRGEPSSVTLVWLANHSRRGGRIRPPQQAKRDGFFEMLLEIEEQAIVPDGN